MKKVILFAAVLSAFSFASCKKDRSCTCTASTTIAQSWTTTKDYTNSSIANSTETGSSSTGGSGSGIIVFNDAKKKDAKKACISSKEEDVETDESNSFGYSTINGNMEYYTSTTVTTTTTTSENTCDLK
ncbi:MAG TPA: hypothetical protein VF868_07845 [Bacteroidia bacterium]|jgi:hypothetical protein